jgi:hypothetical protein
MHKIDQYLNYVESYTELSKITTLCILSSQRSSPLYQPPEHLYRSRKAPTVGSCAEILNHTDLQWYLVENLHIACDCRGRPLIRIELCK